MRPILIVDDDAIYRGYLTDILAREAVPALAAPTARTALSLLNEHEIGGIVIDIMMPDMDGLELVRAVRRRQPALPILVITAHDKEVAEVYLKAASALGATYFGRKGADDRQLLRQLCDVANFRVNLARRAGPQ